MGMFSNDEEPTWEMVWNLRGEVKRYRQILEQIKDRIELYNDCYEGTPDECIACIKKIVEVDEYEI